MDTWQIVVAILGCIVVIIAAYYCTLLIGKAALNSSSPNRSIRVLERFALSRDKLIVIVEIQQQIYILAYAAAGVTVIDHLVGEQAQNYLAGKPQAGMPFAKAFKQQLHNRFGKSNQYIDKDFSQYIAEQEPQFKAEDLKSPPHKEDAD